MGCKGLSIGTKCRLINIEYVIPMKCIIHTERDEECPDDMQHERNVSVGGEIEYRCPDLRRESLLNERN